MPLPGWLCPPRRGLSAALAALLCAVLLVACGSDDRNESAAVRKDITEALTTTDKDTCKPTTYATQKFVDQQSFSIPELARLDEKDCRKDIKARASDSVKVSKVKVDGERATARFTAKGGAAGFGDLEVTLVKDGSWKFDELTAVDIDRAKFNKLGIQRLNRGDASTGVKLSKAQICGLRRLDRFSDAELEQAVVKADVKLVVDPVLVCGLRPRLRKEGASIRQTGCVLRALRSQGEKVLRVLFKEDQSGTEELFGQAAAGCGL